MTTMTPDLAELLYEQCLMDFWHISMQKRQRRVKEERKWEEKTWKQKTRNGKKEKKRRKEESAREK